MRSYRVVLLLVSATLLLPAQDVRPKDVREMAKAGSSAIPKLQELLQNPDAGVRIEAVRQITEIGTAASLDALILATRDNDPEVQIRATDGLVNFYLPGYVKTGIGASLRRVGIEHQGPIHGHQRPGDRPLRHGAAGGDRRARQTGERRREHGCAGQRRARPRHPARQESHSRPGGSPAFEEQQRDLRIAGGFAEDPRGIGRAARHVPVARPRPKGANRRHRNHGVVARRWTPFRSWPTCSNARATPR